MTANYPKRLIYRGLRCVAGFGVAFTISASPAAQPILDRQLAEAKPFHDSPPPAQPSRWDFDFGEGRALLRKDGTWQVEAEIRHGGFRCGQYRLGVRFGAGKPGCLDVTWLGEPMYATNQKHCNNAVRPHRGSGYDALLSDAFEGISCAERLIRCTGLCSARQEGIIEPAPRFGD
jgi:hypothetical protein